MSKSVKDCIILTLLTIAITLLVWLPHVLALPNFWGLNFKEGFSTIYRNFDGLEYVIIAKSFYNPAIIASLPQTLSANYYAAHFPGYALLILLFSPLLGFLKSMIFVSLSFTCLSVIIFYLLVKDFKLTNHPLFLSFIFLILPARWLIVHSVGSAEPVFIFFVVAALYFFLRFELSPRPLFIFLTGIFGMLSQLTRPPGILLFLALIFYIIWKTAKQKVGNFLRCVISNTYSYFPLLLIPLTLLGVFYLYSITYHDFFAYFHSGDNIHLTFPPFQVFNRGEFWVGSMWLEDIVYIFTLGFLGGLMLLKKKLYPLAFFVLTYLTASAFVAHRDISRYVLPVVPFVLIAFEKILTSKEFKIILPIILLAAYLYSQNFILANT
ncbi:glycosyltransferase family 39 protein, partial [Patescibacteria group bacterium]|nr:glycosyltransferase family 39 protein [Patescibacteria group bacterium]